MSKKKLTNDEISFFCEQLSLVINAGIPLVEGAEMIAENAGGGRATEVAEEMTASLADNKTLFEAMDNTGAFPQYAVNMVKIGTLSGRLDDVLKGLSEYYEQTADRMRTVRSAVMHPFILISMMAVVMIVLIIQVIPMFSDIFGQFNSTVSESVSASVRYAYVMAGAILAVLCVLLVISAVIALLAKIPSVRKKLASFASSFVLTRKSAGVFTQAKFANAMSMMVSSGIEASMALENAKLLIDDKAMTKRIDECHDKVVEGAPFADALNETDLLPKIYSRSLKMSYRSGSFDEAWKRISDRCSEEADITSENLVGFIEPVLIAIMAVMIGAILLTVMLPMLDIMSSLG
ncbi:MAG: type II secretion system F family protein [Ruminiclostridium sp.]|nr:type II secretion system F family protein [Ruminiclostridium sp.]